MWWCGLISSCIGSISALIVLGSVVAFDVCGIVGYWF